MKSKKITKRIVALVMATLVVMTGLVIVSAGATVEKNIDSWATLKTELGKLSSGAVAVFNITEKITATEELTIPSGTTVSLVCGNSNHSAATIDIQRAMAYDGHLFRVPDSATLKVQCCISGRGFSDGNWQGFFTTTNADKVTGNTMSSDKTCYGRALILNYGDVELIGSKAVLKHNYNPYSNVSDENGYLQNFHRSSGNDTVSGGWSSKQIVYPVVANSGNAMKGGAIYNKNGSLVIKKDDTGSPSIYDCIAEFGGAICHETIYSTDDLIIEEGNIYNCVSRQAGGAIYSVINTDTSSSSTGQATWLNFRIGSADGADTDISIRDNRAPQGGGVYSNIRVDMNCGTITNNEATGRFSAAKDVGVWGIAKVARGGGVYITGTSDEAVYGKPSLNLKGGVISNNKADSGAGVYASGTAGTVNMSGGKITGNQAGVLSQESLKNYRKITTVGDSAVIYPKDGSGDGIVDYYDSVRAGNFYDTDAADSYEKNFALFVLKEKYLHTFWEEKFANISTDKNLGAAADRDKLLALLNNSVDDGGLYKGNEVVDGVEYRLYKPITLYFESSSGLDVEYGSKFYNEYYIGFRANRFDNDGYYSETSSDSVVFGKYKDGAFVASKTENIFWEGPYVDDKVSFFGVEFKTSEDFVYDETQELAADELTTGSYYNSNVTSRFFTKTAITNEDLYDKYSDYIGLGGGIYSGTDVNITGGTIGGENVIGLDFKDAETLGTITNLKGNISYKAGGGIYMNGGTLTINGKSASVEGNLTDENGGGVFVQSRQSDDVDGVLKFLRGTVANNRATLNYNPASGPKAGGGSGGGIYLAMTAQPSIIGVEGTDKDAWPQIYGNECLNYGGGIHSFVKGSVKLNEASSGGYDITTPGLTINNANIYHNKTGLNFRDGLNYSSGGGVSSNGALLIKGGNISANFSNSNGAGVYCTQYRPDDSYSYSRGAFKMTGGTIENNGRWAYDYDSVELELFPGWTIPWVETTYTQVDIGGGAYSTTYGQPMVFEGTKDNIIQIVNNYANKGAGVYSNRWAHRMSVDTTDSNYSSSNDGYANYGTEFIYCNISGNTAQSYGGGVALGTSALFKNTTVSKNKALTSHGGGIRVAYDSADFIDVINTKIFENEAKSGNGGGIFNYGVVNLISGEVYDNKAGVGGGICNSSYGSGGLVYNDKIYFKVGNGSFQKKDGYSKKVFAKLNINPEALGDVKIYNNEAVSGAGGGVYFSTEGEPSTINNALIYGNKAKTYGGGICTYRSNTKTMTYPDASSNTNTVKTDVSNVVITNSNVNENKAEKGAGIYSSASSELLLNKGVSISENIASDTGGGVCLNKGSLSATEVTVSNNIAKSGAGLHITGDTNITNSYLKDNSVESGVLGNGGGININSGVTKITGGEISGNSSTQYGGGVFNNATVEISETTIEGNIATENGGGVNASNSSVSTKLTNCTISDNEAKFGGGVFEHSRSTKENGLRITGCILTENKALEDGGGLYLSHAPKSVADSLSIIENTEFTLNNAKRGAGIFNYGRFKVVGDTKIHKNTAVNYGGGLYITTGSNDIETNLVSVDFYENHAGYGGGAIDNADTLVIDSKDVLIHNNTTDNKGGGILNTGTLTLGEIVVNNNTALNQGGGIYNGGTFVADGLELLSNESGSTAAGLITFGSATIKNATIKGNNSGGHCGGIGVDAGGSLTLSDSKITENTGENGAGIYIVKSSVGSVITGCEVFNNVSSNIGGGIFIAGDTELTNTTIHDNKAAVNAGGVYWCGKDINSSTFDVPSGVKIFDNTARDAAGMYILDGTVNLVGGEIYNNITNTSG
ncbi:MAG: hypothetical protein UGF89_10875, partial [Acutalibacteraceae bacterium]|nr:hypothetical protein [Acutalibacteraceae bacterium]